MILLVCGCEEEKPSDTNNPVASFRPVTGARVGVEYVILLQLEYENLFHPTGSDEPLPTINFKSLVIPEWLELIKERKWGDDYLLKGTPEMENLGIESITIGVTNGIKENLYNFDLEIIENSLQSVFVPVVAGEYVNRHFDANNDIVEDIETIDYSFEIMKYEVTNQEFVEYLNEAFAWGEVYLDSTTDYGFSPRFGVVGYHPGDALMDGFKEKMLFPFNGNGSIDFDGQTFSVAPGIEAFPVSNVTWYGAWTYAKHYGLMIPLYQEWQKAACGMVGGDFALASRPTAYLGNYANFKDSGDPLDNGPTPVGYFDGNHGTRSAPSPYETYDMTGNVAEWNIHYSSYKYNRSSNPQTVSGGHFMLPLLPFERHTDPAQLYCWSPGSYKGATASETIGFRCVRK